MLAAALVTIEGDGSLAISTWRLLDEEGERSLGMLSYRLIVRPWSSADTLPRGCVLSASRVNHWQQAIDRIDPASFH